MNEADSYKSRYCLPGQTVDVHPLCEEGINLRNPILTRNSSSAGQGFPSSTPEETTSTFRPFLISQNQSDLYLTNGEPYKNQSETSVFGLSRLKKDMSARNEVEAANNLFEPVCLIKTVSDCKQIKHPKNRKKTTFVKEEEKNLFKAHNDTTCFVCYINFVDHDLLLDHLREGKFFCRVCTAEFTNHTTLENHFTGHKGHKCVTCNVIFFCKKDMLQHFKKSKTCNKDTDKFQCELCDKSFARLRVLKKHKLLIHSSGEGKFECVVCKKEFNRKLFLEKHLNAVHTVYEYIPCKICGKLYLGQKPLTHHMQQVHFENMKNVTFVCDICGKIFVRESILKCHLAVHDRTEALCEHCGQTVSGGKKGMQMHLNYKHSGKVFTCEVCSKQFDSRQKLRSHGRKHKGTADEPQYCEICGKKYKNTNVLKQHLMIHSDERNFKCDICGASFKQRVTLRTHSRVHSDTLKYSCDYCGQTFRWKQTFQKHIDKCRSSFD